MENRQAEILLIEDSLPDVRLTERALRNGTLAKQVSVVRDGEQALAFLRRQGEYANAPRPDIILLDLGLPKKNGAEVLAEIKKDPAFVGNQQKWDTFGKERSGGCGSIVGLPALPVVAFAPL